MKTYKTKNNQQKNTKKIQNYNFCWIYSNGEFIQKHNETEYQKYLESVYVPKWNADI